MKGFFFSNLFLFLELILLLKNRIKINLLEKLIKFSIIWI